MLSTNVTMRPASRSRSKSRLTFSKLTLMPSPHTSRVVSLIVELDLVAPGEFVKKQRRDSTETGTAGPSVMH
jgi:hypothetical protein